MNFHIKHAEIIKQLVSNRGSGKQTAVSLGIPRSTFYYNCKRHRIDPNNYRIKPHRRPMKPAPAKTTAKTTAKTPGA